MEVRRCFILTNSGDRPGPEMQHSTWSVDFGVVEDDMDEAGILTILEMRTLSRPKSHTSLNSK